MGVHVSQAVIEALIEPAPILVSQAVLECLIRDDDIPLPPTEGVGVRIYDSTGKRKLFPASRISVCNWDLIEQGYFGNATLTLPDDFDPGDISLTGGDKVEIWWEGTLRYRGVVGTPERQLDTVEKKVILAYGLAERLNSIIVNKRYAWPGGIDVSQAFAKIVHDYVLPIIPGLVLDIQEVGFDIENLQFDRVTAREAMASLISQCANRAVWGFDYDDDLNDRIFFRPKGTSVLYKHTIGGRVKNYSYPPDYSKIINDVHVIGGEAKYPNLVLNSSFESPKQADSGDYSLLTDGGFEYGGAFWSYGGGGQRSSAYARTGSYCADLGHGAGAYTQQANRNITPGETYTIEVWYFSPVTASFHIEVTPDLGSVPNSPTYSCSAVNYGGSYRSVRYSFVAPAGSDECTVRVESDQASANFRVDDISMWRTSGVTQEGWQSLADNEATTLYDWAYDADSYHGQYSVRYTCTVPNGYHVWLLQGEAAAIQVKGSRQYNLSAWVKDLGTTNFKLVMWVNKESGAGRWVESDEFSAQPGGARAAWNWTSASDDRQVRVGIRFDADSDVLMDAFMFRDYDANEDNHGTYYTDLTDGGYVVGKQYEFDIDTDAAVIQVDSTLPAAVKESIANNGRRQAVESVEGIADSTQAANWAIGYFGIKAQPVTSHRVDIADWDDPIEPKGLFKLLNTDIEPAFPVKVGHSIGGDGMLNLSVELNTERPTFEGLLRNVVEQARRAAKLATAGSASSAAPGGGGGSSGGGSASDQDLRTTASPVFVALTLTQATGTKPMTISSTTMVNNLNADMLDGVHLTAIPQLAVANVFTAAQTVTKDGLAAVVTSGLTLQNTTTATSAQHQYSPALILVGQGWNTGSGGVSETDSIAMFVRTDKVNTPPNPVITIALKRNAGSWTEIWGIDAYGQAFYALSRAQYDLRYAFKTGADLKTGTGVFLGNDASALTYDQGAPAIVWRVYGKKTDAGGSNEYAKMGLQVRTVAHATHPISNMLFLSDVSATYNADPSRELLRLVDGGEIGATFNEGAVSGYVFRVEGNTDPNLLLINSVADAVEIAKAATSKIGFFGQTARVQCAKASFNNWAAFTDVVDALVSLGLFDAA